MTTFGQRGWLLVALALLLGAWSWSAAARPSALASRAEAAEAASPIRAGEVLVVLRPGARAAAVAGRGRAAVGEPITPAVQRLRVPAGEERARARALRADPEVAAAAPNYVRRAQAVPNDPLFPQQWGPRRIEAPSAWETSRGEPGITIAVLDSGVDPRHPDLAAKLLPGASFLHVDPAPIPAGSTCPPNAGVDDDFGHGTHVAGIAAAATDNGLGVAGIGWQTRLLPVKVLDCTGNGSDAQVIAGIDWAVGQRAWVVNLSFGGPGQSDVLDAAIDRARRAGVLVVAAAGNGATDVPFYPAASPGALAVTATDQQDRFAASFSNRGSYVGLAAPGVDIVSTYPTYMEPVGYRVMSGTSMAAPHVSGVAALLLSRHPEYGPSRTMGVLFASAEKVESCPPGVAACPYDRLGRNDYYGYGRVNAARALRFTSAGLLPLILNRASP